MAKRSKKKSNRKPQARPRTETRTREDRFCPLVIVAASVLLAMYFAMNPGIVRKLLRIAIGW
jgi:hypothetical protein